MLPAKKLQYNDSHLKGDCHLKGLYETTTENAY